MAPPDPRRSYKRPAISDQERRRELALRRQSEHRADSQARARSLLSSVISLSAASTPSCAPAFLDDVERVLPDSEIEHKLPEEEASGSEVSRVLGVVEASRMKGGEAKRWFARQLMLPEWMVDVPTHLQRDWYVLARPAGKRCLVVSLNGTTVSRLRNGSVLHLFPSSLPNGAKTKDLSGNSYSILDCIFHEPDETYYVIDMVCWRDYSLYECSAEFRFFWLNSKLAECGACNPPSAHHHYRFSVVPIYECSDVGLLEAYSGGSPYMKDGLLFYNKHAHYQAGNTPLVLVWKDENCCKYVLDTDSRGEVPREQQLVLELQEDGRLTTSDEPPVAFGSLGADYIQKFGLRAGNLLRFAIKDENVRIVDGKMETTDLQFLGKAGRSRAFADSHSKALFQYAARHCPLRFDYLAASVQSTLSGEFFAPSDVEMSG